MGNPRSLLFTQLRSPLQLRQVIKQDLAFHSGWWPFILLQSGLLRSGGTRRSSLSSYMIQTALMDAADNLHIFLSGYLMTNMGEYLDHYQGKRRKDIFQEPLWSGVIKVTRKADTTFQLFEYASFLIQISGHKHFLGNIMVRTYFFSPGAISSASNSFILMRKKIYSSALSS